MSANAPKQPTHGPAGSAPAMKVSTELGVHPPGYRKRRGQNWFFLGLTYASYYLCRYNLSPIAPDLKSELGLNNAQYGMINSGRDGAYAVGQMVNGLFTDRLGGKKAMTIGAIGTVVLNVLFGLTTWWNFSLLLPVLVLIRSADGYMQAFGAPGFIKINTAWFTRKERGAFAGVFGFMINLGAIGAGLLGTALARGAAVPLLFFTLTVPAMNWRYMFFIPPLAVVVIVILMNFAVKNNPEEAGFQIAHEDEEDEKKKPKPQNGTASFDAIKGSTPALARINQDSVNKEERVRLRDVFRKIASNPIVWIVAGAYFCTGFVRRGIESWWSIFLNDVLSADATSSYYKAFVWGLPLTAFVGSLTSGYVSDLFFRGRRAPVAAMLYGTQFLLTILMLFLPSAGTSHFMAWVSVIFIILISMMCNSTHSILGTAAAMDLGGRKMAGCAAGIIDSFQYYGSILSGGALGLVFDYFGASAMAAAGADGHVKMNPTIWIASMLPFGFIGTGLMTYLWLKHGKSGARGA